MRPAAQPLPFDADQDRWTHAVREAARLHHAVRAELAGRLADPAAERAAMEALLLIRERTRGGWLRWDIFGPHPAGVLREAGVFAPGQHWLGRWACRTVWGRRPPLYIWTLGCLELPRPLPVGRTALFTVVAFAALGPATSQLPTAAGLPAAVRRLTRRRVRVIETGESYAAVFFRLLADEQRMRMLAERSRRYELTRAAAVLPRLVWDAAGLVRLAADVVEARELLLGYAQSLALLVNQAVEVERQEEAVESAVRDGRAAAVQVRPPCLKGCCRGSCWTKHGWNWRSWERDCAMPGMSWAAPTTTELSMRGVERQMSEHELDRPAPWRKAHPEAYAELKRTWGVIGHSAVLMVLSLSLIGTSLTVGYLDVPGRVETLLRLGASAAAVGCGAVGLWRLVRALFRSVRAGIRTRQRGAEGKAQGETVEESVPEAAPVAGPS
ncbi:hypothetical protein [Streptomyces sp. AS58]|uniref:hypothetical protein n=1 Tax=Streptomyces sp. AS58 TaxID=1519489 RepID=UPI0006B00713|nr:hypothetical protein [Streptomyces sp. AS58]